MPSVYDLKPAFQRRLRPAVRTLARWGVTPNQLTAGAMALCLGFGTWLCWQSPEPWSLVWLAPLLFVRMALNALDGMLAREHNLQSAGGAILNEVGDVVSDAALYLPLAFWPQLPAALIVPAVVLASVTELTGIVGVQIGASRRYDGPMGKSDRAVVFGGLALAIGLGAPDGWWFTALLGLILLLLVLTIVNRARGALREVACEAHSEEPSP